MTEPTATELIEWYKGRIKECNDAINATTTEMPEFRPDMERWESTLRCNLRMKRQRLQAIIAHYFTMVQNITEAIEEWKEDQGKPQSPHEGP